MRRFSLFTSLALLLAMAGLFPASFAYAATPTLSLSVTSGDMVQITVNGDPNANVMFYYNVGSSSGMQVNTLGTTNASGYFSTSISTSFYGVIPGNSVYVIVNSQQSTMQAWPNVTGSTPSGTPTLSQTSITLGLGQSMTVSSQSGSVYMPVSSNPSIANVAPNGSQIVVTGIQLGSTTATICYTGTATNCATLYITVQASSTQTLSFNQNNISLSVGGSQSVVISGGSGTYAVSNNSNTAVASTSLSGNTITVNGLVAGSATITVCDQSSNCGPLYLTVGTTSTNQPVSFSVTNPTLTMGQSLNIGLTGASSYFISTHAHGNVTQAILNGSTLTLLALSGGSDSITVCAAGGGCNTLSVTVTGTATTPPPPPPPTPTTSNSDLLAQIQSLQSQLTQILSQIQTIQTKLQQLTLQVTGSSSGGTTGSGTSSSGYQFLNPLSLGASGADVTALQNRLIADGFYAGPVTGYFGSLTMAAVQKYQTANGLTPLGTVGPATRAILNTGK